MTTFYCVRHGKTEFNQKKTFQGGLADSPLLEEGIEGAKLVGKHLKDVPFKKVLVSPQKRAQDTASFIVKEHNQPISIETIADLREMEFGEWDGFPEANYHHEVEFQNLVHRPHEYNPSAFSGESFDSLITRVTHVFESFAKEYPNDTILLVAHGLLLQTLLKTFQGVPLADVRKGDALANTSVSTVVSDDNGKSFHVTKWNDTSFADD